MLLDCVHREPHCLRLNRFELLSLTQLLIFQLFESDVDRRHLLLFLTPSPEAAARDLLWKIIINRIFLTGWANIFLLLCFDLCVNAGFELLWLLNLQLFQLLELCLWVRLILQLLLLVDLLFHFFLHLLFLLEDFTHQSFKIVLQFFQMRIPNDDFLHSFFSLLLDRWRPTRLQD